MLGGTFNPVHTAHLILAQDAAEAFDLSKVIFIPCAEPPHKKSAALASAEHRMSMLLAAVESNLLFEVSDMELRRGGTSYAFDTVAELNKLHPSAELCFIIGSDTLLELHLWRNIYGLLPLCRFLTFARPGWDVSSISPPDIHLDPPWPERLLQDTTVGRLVCISSTDVRYRIAEGMSIRYLVPGEVEMYIAEHSVFEQ